MTENPSLQRMFHGQIKAPIVAEQLAVRFRDRFHQVTLDQGETSALVTIGSPHGTPVAVHLADTQGGVLVTMGRGPSNLSAAGDAADRLERAATNPLSFLAALPDVIAEARKKNIIPQIWSALDEIFHLARSLAGEENAPPNPKVCPYCQSTNPPQFDHCQSCGYPLEPDLPRNCPKCARAHTSDALFCQACGTRLIEEST